MDFLICFPCLTYMWNSTFTTSGHMQHPSCSVYTSYVVFIRCMFCCTCENPTFHSGIYSVWGWMRIKVNLNYCIVGNSIHIYTVYIHTVHICVCITCKHIICITEPPSCYIPLADHITFIYKLVHFVEFGLIYKVKLRIVWFQNVSFDPKSVK